MCGNSFSRWTCIAEVQSITVLFFAAGDNRMSMWTIVGYVVGIPISVVALLCILTCLAECVKKYFAWFVRTWCCMDDFGRNWDGDFSNDSNPRSQDSSLPKNMPSLPKVRLESKRTTKPTLNQGEARGQEGDMYAPDLSLLSDPSRSTSLPTK